MTGVELTSFGTLEVTFPLTGVRGKAVLCGVEGGPATEGVVAADAGYVVDELSRAVVERVLRRDSLGAEDDAP